MAEDASITFDENDQRLLVSWDNRKMRKDRLLMIFFTVILIAMAAGSIVAIWNLIQEVSVFWTVWLIFGVIATISIPGMLTELKYKEWIIINATEIAWGLGNSDENKKTKSVSISDIQEMTYGRTSTDDYSGSFYALTIWRRAIGGIKPNYYLGCWLHADLKKEIFDRIQTYTLKHGIPLKMNVHTADE